jgi:lysozyme family protein
MNWPEALRWVRADEGGNDDDPSDNGGRTSRGITQREYTACCHLYHWTPGDVWKAPDTQIDTVYKLEYWDPYCDLLPSGTDYLFFDFNVNAGLRQATLLLQRCLGVKDDGKIGPITKSAALKMDPTVLIGKYTAAKKHFYTELALNNPHDRKFLKGWISRADHVAIRAKSLIHDITEEQPTCLPKIPPTSAISPLASQGAPSATSSPPSVAPSSPTASSKPATSRGLSAWVSSFWASLGRGGKR